MPTLITNYHNNHLIINLDNVVNIEKSEHLTSEGGNIFNIHFSYSAMCDEREMDTSWKFKSKEDCEETFNRIISVFDVVAL